MVSVSRALLTLDSVSVLPRQSCLPGSLFLLSSQMTEGLPTCKAPAHLLRLVPVMTLFCWRMKI